MWLTPALVERVWTSMRGMPRHVALRAHATHDTERFVSLVEKAVWPAFARDRLARPRDCGAQEFIDR